MDITNAYMNEPSMYTEPIYVQSLPNSEGNNISGRMTDKLIKNVWGGVSAGHYYTAALFSFLLGHVYTQSGTDGFLLSKH